MRHCLLMSNDCYMNVQGQVCDCTCKICKSFQEKRNLTLKKRIIQDCKREIKFQKCLIKQIKFYYPKPKKSQKREIKNEKHNKTNS